MWELAGPWFFDLCTDVPYAIGVDGLMSVHTLTLPDKRPSPSRAGSRLALLVHQGSDHTQPYPTLVIRDRAPRFSTALRLGVTDDVVRPLGQDGRSVGSDSP